MKNLFKNLMLVAVAAMAFTACTETNEEVNAVSKTTRYEFTANIADETRSGFAEKEEGATAYKSEWFGDESLKVYVTNYADFNGNYTTSISEDGKFVLDIDAPESFFMTILSPAESWVNENTATIPAVQTPLANSVDPAAHLLKAQAVPVNNGVADINMTHMAAYGKMTVNGVDFDIDHVVIDLKGSFYGYDRELSYTINATNVENNTFWFATEPIDVAEFTVTAYGAGDEAVAKTVDVAAAGKTMSFQYGRVGTFSVSGLEAVVVPEPEEPEEFDGPVFDSSYCASSYGQDRYVYFSTNDSSLNVLKIDFYNCFDESKNTLKAGEYSTPYSSGIYGGMYTTYGGVEVGSITVTVSYVYEGYCVVVKDVKDAKGNLLLEKAIFKGPIDGLADVATKPKMVLSHDSLKFASDASNRTITVDLLNCSYSISATSSNEHFTTSVDGNKVIVSAQANETDESIYGVITITAGELSQEVNVEQTANTVVSEIEDGSKEHPYIYDTCTVINSGTYFKMTFQSDADGAKQLYLESNNNVVGEFKSGVISQANNWYPGACSYAKGAVTTTWDESTIKLTNIGDREFSFDEIKISTFDGYVYYKCNSVVFP